MGGLSTTATVIIIIFAVIILLIFYGIGVYNKLVNSRNKVKDQWAQIDVQLKRRADLIPNLVEVTKSYAEYESTTLQKLIEARNQAQTVEEVSKNASETTKTLNRLFALTENYPDLKANELFKNLQVELTGTEDKIAFARQFYNDCVQVFNNAIMVFPNNILAKIFHYHEKEYFQIEQSERENIKVKL